MASITNQPAAPLAAGSVPPTFDLQQTRDVLEQIALIHQAVGQLGTSAVRAHMLATRDHLASLLPGGVPGGQGLPVAMAATLELSGPIWVSRFPGSASPDDCIDPFRANLKAFLAALAKAGAQVSIAATFRPPERAYLMHWAWQIARNFVDPQEAGPMAGVDIDWVHRTAAGVPDIPKSRAAASQMVSLYQIVSKPALTSRHTERRAVDMNISWQGSLSIDRPNGGVTTISSGPQTGLNAELIQIGAIYGVIKSQFDDPPHWSDDGA